MVVIYGTNLYGRVDHVGDTYHVATRFAHLYYLPLIPLSSWLVVNDTESDNTFSGWPVGLRLRSVVSGYLRAWGGGAALVGALAAGYHGFRTVLGNDSLAFALSVVLAALVGFLVVAALVARPRRALLAGSAWVVLTLVLMAYTGLVFPQCWTAVLGGVGLTWLTRLRWDRADHTRALKLAAAAGLPAELLLVHLAPGGNLDNDAVAGSDSRATLRSTHELVWQLGHSDDEQRLQAVEQLAGRDDSDATRALVSCLGDPSTSVRVTARAALVGMGGAAVAPLCEALEYEDEQVAWTAAELLGEVGDERAVEPLQWASRDARESVRQAARRSLAALGRPVAEYASAEA
jgi:hypothetical protein